MAKPAIEMEVKKKILIVVNDMGAGGAETQALYLATGLILKGWPVSVLSFGSQKGLAWERFQKANIPIRFTGFREKLLMPPMKGWLGWLRYLRYLAKLIWLIKQIQPHVILPFTYPPNIIMGRCWRLTGAKFCFWNQRDEGRFFMGSDWENKGLENCSAIISNSLEGKMFLQRFTKKRISLIYNGVKVPAIHANAEKPGKVRVVMIANLHGYKDHLTLLRAWLDIQQQQVGQAAELLLAGREGSKSAEIVAFIENNNLQNSVTLLGAVADVNGLLNTCHIGVFSSLTEGVPNGILECMAMGLPVVATRITGSEEALGPEYPWLSKAGDAGAMSKMLLHFIEKPQERSLWGHKNRKRVSSIFSMESMILAYEKILVND